MRAFVPRALAAAVLLASSAARLAAASEVDDYLRREMAARSIPGVAWVAVDGDAIAAEGYLGLAGVELDAPVGAGSVFAIASLDKQLTAAGVMVLAQRGKLSLDDPLSRWVPGEWGGITLGHLLSHTSGLPDSVAPAVLGTSLLDYTPESLLGNVRALVPVAPPPLCPRRAWPHRKRHLAAPVSEGLTRASGCTTV